jgi:hypothetical protein
MSEVDDFLAHLALLNAQGGQEAVIAFGVETGIVSPDAAAQMRGTVTAGESVGLGDYEDPMAHPVYTWDETGAPTGGPQIVLRPDTGTTGGAPPIAGEPLPTGPGGQPTDIDPWVPPLGMEGEQPKLADEPPYEVVGPEMDDDRPPVFADVADDETVRKPGEPDEHFVGMGDPARETDIGYYEPSMELSNMLTSWGFPEPVRLDGNIVINDPAMGNVTNRMMGLIEQWMRDPKIGEDELEMLIIQSEPYLDRFPGIRIAMQNNVQTPTASEYLAYERYVTNVFADNGLIADTTMVGQLIGKGISITQVQQRMDAAVDDVLMMPEEVKSMFRTWTGTTDDAAVLSWMLNPEQSIREIERATAEAKFGGFTMMSEDVLPEELLPTYTESQQTLYSRGHREPNYSNLQDLAKELSHLNLSRQQVTQGWGQIKDMEHLFAETMREDKDFSALKEGVDVAFGAGAAGSAALARRIRQRVATNQGGGGASVGRSVTGFGSANR